MAASERIPVYGLLPQLMKNPKAEHRLGGRTKDDPPRVVLTAEEPYIYSDQPHLERYEMYVGQVLRKVPKPSVPVEEVQDDIDAIVSVIETNGSLPEPVAPAPIPEPKPTREEKLSDPVELVEPSEGEVEVVDRSQQIPDPVKLRRMKRPQLLELAEEIGVWNDIVPTGNDDYVTKDDVINHLLRLREQA